ncbi:MAG: hypothetical protein Q7S73_00830 [bacterium]|nr:hypothetical protein [bacterium]
MAKTNVLVSAAGWLLGFTEKLVRELKKQGVTDEAIHNFVKDDGDVAVEKIAAELAKLMRVSFPTCKSIKLGTGLKTADDFRRALKAGGYQIGRWANDILGQPVFKAAQKETEVELVKVSVVELGFRNGATWQEIYQRAKELGLELCPNEVGPQLRLQYKDQPNGEWLLIAMEPITDSVGCLRVFVVEHGAYGRWLLSYYAYPEGVWHSYGQWLFVRRK